MKTLAITVVLLYVAVLVALTVPLLGAAFQDPGDATNAFRASGYWAFLFVLGLCQLALLFVPVKLAAGRPTSRRSLALPIVVTAFLLGLLAAGVVAAVMEWIYGEAVDDWQMFVVFAALLGSWAGWGVYFANRSAKLHVHQAIDQHGRMLRRSSILTILVAVPAHIAVRQREYCCAGFLTFTGLVFGIAVMLLAFGPAIYFAFAARLRQTRAEGR